MGIKQNTGVYAALIGLAFPFICLGQLNYSLAEEGIKWYMTSQLTNAHDPQHFWYEKLDTNAVIQGETFLKFGRKSHPVSGYDGYRYLREDTITARVFLYNKESDSSYVIMDMHAELGDTLWFGEADFVNDGIVITDTIKERALKDGTKRLSVQFRLISNSNLDSGQTYVWFDGLGSNYGLDFPNNYSGLSYLGLDCIARVLVDTVKLVRDCNGILSAPESPEVESWAVYPNPADSFIRIDAPIDRIQQIKVINQHGQIVALHKPRHEISISELEDGMYFLRIEGPENSQTTLFVKGD